MYAKLFSRITESSLMEEPIEVRYTFVMLLAIADPHGYVIGTDVAIARRLNVPLAEFQRCVAVLMSPDPHSNSKAEDGRRVIESDGERGYFLVNFTTYRDMKDEETRRNYMRDYMRKYRGGKQSVNDGKQSLTQEEAEEDAKEKEEAETFSPPKAAPSNDGFDDFWQAYPKRVGKANAEKAWKKLGCARILPQILTSIRKCKISQDWTKDAGQFIPHPATWLNRRGWEDELQPRNGGGIQEHLTPHIE